jgi:hypothetical protein
MSGIKAPENRTSKGIVMKFCMAAWSTFYVRLFVSSRINTAFWVAQPCHIVSWFAPDLLKIHRA